MVEDAIDAGTIGTYLEGRGTDSKHTSTSVAERAVVEDIFRCKDDAEMIARLGSLMVENLCLDEQESCDYNNWMAFGQAVMLELGNRGKTRREQ